jgi:hypothetical protein
MHSRAWLATQGNYTLKVNGSIWENEVIYVPPKHDSMMALDTVVRSQRAV